MGDEGLRIIISLVTAYVCFGIGLWVGRLEERRRKHD